MIAACSTEGNPTDKLAPGAIGTLAAAPKAGDATGTIAVVTWTAVDQDAKANGTAAAASYELRYQQGTCTLDASFAAGTVVATGTPKAPGGTESLDVQLPASDAPYCFQVKVSDAAGNFALSNIASVVMPDVTAPAAVTDLAAVSASATTATVTFTAVDEDDKASGTKAATTYELRWQQGDCTLGTDFTAGTAAATGTPKAPGSAESFTVTLPASDAPYCFRLKVSDEAGNSSLSNVANLSQPDVTAPAAAAIAAAVKSATAATVTWAAVDEDGSATGTKAAAAYELRWQQGTCTLDANFAAGTVAATGTPKAPGSAESFDVTLPASDTAYCFRLKISDEANNSSLSNVAHVTLPDVTPPEAVSDLDGVAKDGDGTGTIATMTWTAVDEDGNHAGTRPASAYELRYQAIGSAADCTLATAFGDGTVLDLGTPGAPGAPRSRETFDVTLPASDALYCLRLEVIDDAGNFSLSNVADVQLPDVTPPADVTDLAVEQQDGDTTGTAIHATWTPVGDDGGSGVATSQSLAYEKIAVGAECSISAGTFSTFPTLALEAPIDPSLETPEAYDLNVPASDAKYCFLLKVSDEGGNSSYSNVATVTLPDVTPPADVDDLAATAQPGGFTLRWTASGDDGRDGTAFKNIVYYGVPEKGCPVPQPPYENNFNSAEFTPVQPGGSSTLESQAFTDLSFGVDYCVFVVVRDEVGNESAPSNVVAVTTLAADPIPPDAVADLHADVSLNVSGLPHESPSIPGPVVQPVATLRWLAPKDTRADLSTAPVSAYELRMLTDQGETTCPMTADNFAQGTLITDGMPTPGEPGNPEQVAVPFPLGAQTVCFALRSTDGANFSPLSNFVAPPGPAFLATTAVTDTSVDLEWPQMANDGFDTPSGVVSKQELRMRTGPECPVTADNFDDSPDVPLDELVPAAVGQTTTFHVGGLGPDSSYCFMLRASDPDETPNTSMSFSISVTTPDTTPPAPILAVDIGDVAIGAVAAGFTFPASGDDGSTGAATRYEGRLLAGAGCADGFAGAAPFDIPIDAPVPAGDPIALGISPLASSTHYCVAVIAYDDHDNPSELNAEEIREFDTAADTSGPDSVEIVTPAKGEVQSAGATLHFVAAPADDAGIPASGKVDHYDVRTLALADCSGLTGGDFGGATPVSTVSAPSADPGDPETVTVTYAPAPDLCLAVSVVDHAGNTAEPLSNWVHLRDNTAPALVTDVVVSNVTSSAAQVAFTTSGDDGTAGRASTYDLRYLTGASCAVTDENFGSATALAGFSPTVDGGSTETLQLTGLSYQTHYCFGLQVDDEVPNASATVGFTVDTGTPSTASQIAAVRAAIAAGAATPVGLSNLPVQGAVVTYVKTAGTAGTSDGAGFTIQAGAGPALFVAMDPASFGGGVLAGDQVEFVATQGAWLACTTCTAANSLYGVTAATGAHVRSTGNTLPAAADVSSLTAVDLPAPIAAANWSNEALLVNVTGTLATTPLSANGFTTAQAKTSGVTAASANVLLRMPDALAASLALQNGDTFKLTGVPLWRQNNAVVFEAWTAADITLLNPHVASTNPPDGTLNSSATVMTVTFTQPVDLATLTGQATTGLCTTGVSIQLSLDGAPLNCQGITLSLDASNTVMTITPAGGFVAGQRYLLKATGAGVTGYKGTSGLNGAVLFAQANGFEIAPPSPLLCSARQLVISQLYGGGGNSGATYTNDFIELHNRGATDMTIPAGGWSVQYAAAGSNFTTSNVTLIPAATVIKAGAYLLIQQAGGSGGTTPLPTPEITGTVSMNAATAKVALVTQAAALGTGPGSCPAVGTNNIIDLVGYGASFICSNYSSAPQLAGTPANATAVLRNDGACAETGNGFNDFSVAAPVPHNKNTPVNICNCSVTDTGVAAEIDYCKLQFPPSMTLGPGQTGSVYGRVYEPGNHTGIGSAHDLKMQVGLGAPGSDPFTQWVFQSPNGIWNSGCDATNPDGDACGNNNDEFQATLTAPAANGTYSYTVRFSVDGANWTYCDADGNGSGMGTSSFSQSALGTLTVQ